MRTTDTQVKLDLLKEHFNRLGASVVRELGRIRKADESVNDAIDRLYTMVEEAQSRKNPR